MSIVVSDIKFRKPVLVTDAINNGGVAGQALVLNGVRHNLFPRVTKAEREDGVTRYRKQFWSNENAGNEIAYGVLAWLEHPSNAGDRFYLIKGSQADIQNDVVNATPAELGTGKLNAGVTAGQLSCSILMENSDFDFPNGSVLHISNKFLTGQTIAAGVAVGDSVQLTTGTWNRIANTTNITHPIGLLVGSGIVMTFHELATEHWLYIAEKKTIQTLANPDGSTATPTLDALATVENGVSPYDGYRPVITTSAAGTPLTVTVSSTGACTGDCTGGQLNMTTGAWTTQITWTANPNVAVSATWYDIPFTYAGPVATVELDESIPVDYSADNTYAGVCLQQEEVKGVFTHGTVTSGGGAVQQETNPITVPNIGSVADTFTITFTSSVAFNVSGAISGALTAGNTGFAYTPNNPNGGTFFTIPSAFWSGSWTSGDTYTFTTTPSKLPMWLKEVVPAGTTHEPSNLVTLGWYSE